MRNSKIIEYSGNGGFTLVEVLVSVVIFSLASVILVQLFLFTLRANKTLLSHSQMIGEISYNLEHIGRGLRMAKKSQATDPVCLSPGNNFEKTYSGSGGIKFQNLNAAGTMDCVEYYLSNGVLMEKRDRNGALLFDLPLTSPKISVLVFEIVDGMTIGGWDQNDNFQPRVTIYIKSQSKEGRILENQITISQRDLDVAE